MRIIQRPQCDGLRAGYPTERTAILRPVGDQHQRRSLRNHRHEIGEHRLTRRVDPVCVLDDVRPPAFARASDGGIDERRQASAPGVGSDSGCSHRRIADSEQVIEQQKILGVGSAGVWLEPVPEPRRPRDRRFPVVARNSRATTLKGMSVVWDSQ